MEKKHACIVLSIIGPNTEWSAVTGIIELNIVQQQIEQFVGGIIGINIMQKQHYKLRIIMSISLKINHLSL